MSGDKLVIRGARENNLKNVDLTLPRDKLIVFTGLSGSGKSSLAFDTIYADGQRRYVESLSSYARMFLGQMDKPDVDSIEGLSPAISIDQKTTSKNPRSTVGTVTEIYDYLRLLYARIGVPHCPVCGREITQQTIDQIADVICAYREGTKLMILAPIIRGRKGEHKKEIESARRGGYVRIRIDGSVYDVSEDIELDKNKKHNIEIVVDRIVCGSSAVSRIAESVETAAALSGGIVIAATTDGEEQTFSQNYACPEHGVSIPALEPRMFSFNNPAGACEKCTGIGRFLKVSRELVFPNKSLSIRQGAIKASGWSYSKGTLCQQFMDYLSDKYNFSLDTPIGDLPVDIIDKLCYGTPDTIKYNRDNFFGKGTYNLHFEGILNNLERRYKETNSDIVRMEIEQSMREEECPECHGKRLKDIFLAVTVGGKNIIELTDMPVTDALRFVSSLELTNKEKIIGERIIKEIRERLGFLKSVGLEYLTLSRSAATLSGGESQRIRLATQIGSSLVGVLYILDEPSIGLHQRDNDKLIATLRRLRDIGNTLIVVEHDEDTMRAADYIVDVGPGAGVHGGEIVFSGTPDEILSCDASITGKYLSGKLRIPVPKTRRHGNGHEIKIIGARENNLKDIDVSIPLGTFTCVTGVSGSGKSSLINEILFKSLSATLNGARIIPGRHKRIEGINQLDKIIGIDQSPIGRTPRSNPATYTGVFTDIRELFSKTGDAAMRGYGAGRFSFNIKGGRCDACEGAGIIKIEMHFLPDVFVPCEVCGGKRYNRETLEVKYKGKTISDVLDMTVEEGMNFFESIPQIYRKLKTLYDVGLTYVKIGQAATTLSGGEAQRVKLAAELSKRPTGKTIYVLDEPTTGLHSADVKKLLEVLGRIVDSGNTVVVIEHNLDVIKTADYIIDLGPEGGVGGGTIVATGTPEEIIRCKASYTGQYLSRLPGMKKV